MAVSAQQFARELRGFADRRQVVKALRRSLTRASKPAVRMVRAHAVEILPSEGGLGRWVSATRVTVRIGYAGRSAGVRIIGTRKSRRAKTALDTIDRGTVRAPSWGRRGPSQWHTQAVKPGWFTDPLAEDIEWQTAADREVDAALDQVRRG